MSDLQMALRVGCKVVTFPTFSISLSKTISIEELT